MLGINGFTIGCFRKWMEMDWLMAHILNYIFGLVQLSSILKSTGSSIRAVACVSPGSGVVARPFLI